MNTSKHSWRLTLVLLMTPAAFCSGQQTFQNVKYFDVVTGDSVILFCYNPFTFSQLSCATFTRNTRLTSSLKFTGPFTDIRRDGSLMNDGFYDNGKKEGYFESLYINGKLQTKGHYKDNKPIGDWYFFYEDGILERMVRFTETDTLLITYVSKKKQIDVENGNGKMNARIGLSIWGGDEQTLFYGRGKIKAGKPDGTWVLTVFGADCFKETWVAGKMVKGKAIKSDRNPFAKNAGYNHSQITVFLEPDYVQLEKFKIVDCDR